MKKLTLSSILFMLTLAQKLFAQGWVLDVVVDINHADCAREKLTSASVSFAGSSGSGSSSGPNTTITLYGTAEPLNNRTLSVSASGSCLQTYNPNVPVNPFSASFSGQFTLSNCTQQSYASSTSPANVSGALYYYPRQKITTVENTCGIVTVGTNTCSWSYTKIWEVSDNLNGPWKSIPKNTATITMTAQELANAGLTSGFGRKYFRVTGRTGTTSEVKTVDIYYPGSEATLTPVDPKCYNGSDGTIQFDITSAYPGQINDFVITAFTAVPPSNPVKQVSIVDAYSAIISGLSARQYWFRIENNSTIGQYGNCYKEFTITLKNPTPVSVALEPSNYFNNGFAIRCNGESSGVIQARPSGGTGVYNQYIWTPNVSTSALAANLKAGSYHVKAVDSNGCPGEKSIILNEPSPLNINLVSIGGSNGYDVSCWDKNDGKIQVIGSGGIGSYSYLWSGGQTENIVQNLIPGTYSVTIEDENECTLQKSKTLLSPQPIEFNIHQIAELNCPGDQNASFEAENILNTIGSVNYSWSSGESTRAIENKAAGTYRVTISDTQGCSASQSIIVEDPKGYTVSISATSNYNGVAISCNGASDGKLGSTVKDGLNQIAPAEYYSWTKNGNPFSEGTMLNEIDNLSKGTYSLRIIYNGNCSVAASAILGDPAPVVTSIANMSNYNGFPISCDGARDGAIAASANGGSGSSYNFSWNTAFQHSGIRSLEFT